jgi:hypothetical protein
LSENCDPSIDAYTLNRKKETRMHKGKIPNFHYGLQHTEKIYKLTQTDGRKEN